MILRIDNFGILPQICPIFSMPPVTMPLRPLSSLSGLQQQPLKSSLWFYPSIFRWFSLLHPKQPNLKLIKILLIAFRKKFRIFTWPSRVRITYLFSLNSHASPPPPVLFFPQLYWKIIPPCFCTIWPLRTSLIFSNRPCFLSSQDPGACCSFCLERSFFPWTLSTSGSK